MLVDHSSPAEVSLCDVVHRVELLATAGESNTLTVSALSTSDTNDVVASEDFERGWVDTLLVDNHEVFVGTVTQALFEFYDLHDSVVRELPFGLDELLSLVGVGPEEAGVDLGLFVLEGDVEVHNKAVLETRRQVTLTTSVIQDKTTHQTGFS